MQRNVWKGMVAVMERKTEDRMGSRCHICTGCGHCRGEKQDIHVLTDAVKGLNKTDWTEKAVSFDNGRKERLVTVDIGTTTIAMQLHGKDGRVQDTFVTVNPQTAYGADVLSRIQAAEKTETADSMKQLVREVLHQGIGHFQSQLEEQETLRMVIAANTTMVYLLMGWDTAELGRAPFHAKHLHAVNTELDGVPCYIIQGLSAFVGGDITAGIVACGMAKQEKVSLLIDLGTNGEMVLGNRHRLIACSTAAGPAFEGGVNRGVWGADMISLLARLRREGILDETGLLEEPYFERGIRIGDVCVTQQSVRAIQLAKGAILAGIRILTGEYGIAMEEIDRIVLAGGFGYYLNPVEAIAIGLLPEEFANKTIAGGNTALAGAMQIGRKLLCEESEGTLADTEMFSNQDIRIDILNLAEQKDFQTLYLSSMDFK